MMFTDEELIAAYKDTPKLGILSAKFKVPNVSIWRRATKLGLEFNSKGGGNNGKFDLRDVLNGKHPQYATGKLKSRLLREGLLENKCSKCGITEWNNESLNMQLDHIDGDCHNHKFDNLRMLCPNCHAQTETYCGKNIKR